MSKSLWINFVVALILSTVGVLSLQSAPSVHCTEIKTSVHLRANAPVQGISNIPRSGDGVGSGQEAYLREQLNEAYQEKKAKLLEEAQKSYPHCHITISPESIDARTPLTNFGFYQNSFAADLDVWARVTVTITICCPQCEIAGDIA